MEHTTLMCFRIRDAVTSGLEDLTQVGLPAPLRADPLSLSRVEPLTIASRPSYHTTTSPVVKMPCHSHLFGPRRANFSGPKTPKNSRRRKFKFFLPWCGTEKKNNSERRFFARAREEES
ncbi:hypothetical protein D8674_041996 [Pyrus ussuriensis x Pyrus communis]|uniref:Uncharacterized protein n=1 Tax=Pyrus ussuriensis x Pyrus communis TaxID=2448454 RepID=A0A5N5H750_9ROSA|nr:hypothetical protein D8674_041996 [Pyrus ussuriensis x Pyrus communis]